MFLIFGLALVAKWVKIYWRKLKGIFIIYYYGWSWSILKSMIELNKLAKYLLPALGTEFFKYI